MESQTGFRYYRGTIDGAFTVINALRKRQEHNLESYVAFIDLIKAFDSVPRAALWKVLLKFGFPRHFVRVVMRLHTGAVMKFKINDQAEDADVASSIGVRQGSNSGPVLFLYIMQAAMETMTWPVAEPQSVLRRRVSQRGSMVNDPRGNVGHVAFSCHRRSSPTTARSSSRTAATWRWA